MGYRIIAERKLKSTWQPEIEKDCDAFHMVDNEQELVYVLSEQIKKEMNCKCEDIPWDGTPTKSKKSKNIQSRKKQHQEFCADSRYSNELCETTLSRNNVNKVNMKLKSITVKCADGPIYNGTLYTVPYSVNIHADPTGPLGEDGIKCKNDGSV